jgi:hypothetical protein
MLHNEHSRYKNVRKERDGKERELGEEAALL